MNGRKEMKDKILIPLVLAFYIGVLAFIGAITSLAETMWTQTNTVASTLNSPYGIFYLSAGTGIALIYWLRRRK